MRSPLKRPRVIGVLLGALPIFVSALHAADCNGNGIPDDRDLKAAQLVFSAPLTFPTGFSPWAVVAVDLEGDGDPDLVTANTYSTSLLDFLFTAGPAPGCLESADADNDGQVDLSDPIALLNFLFLAGAPPAPPGPAPLPCGPDPDSQGSPGDRGCRTYAACRA